MRRILVGIVVGELNRFMTGSPTSRQGNPRRPLRVDMGSPSCPLKRPRASRELTVQPVLPMAKQTAQNILY